jgi:hypothetical protein
VETPGALVDQNCDGDLLPAECLDVNITYYKDHDKDGYATGDTYIATDSCEVVDTDFVEEADLLDLVILDCNDDDAAIYPGAVELPPADGVDQNCDGLDVIELLIWYRDVDEDTFGNTQYTTPDVTQPVGFVYDETDFDEFSDSVYPGAMEIPGDGIDQDCDGKEPALLIVDSFGIKLIYVGSGNFLMGGPNRIITLNKSFYIGKYEITQGQWRTVMGNSPSFHTSDAQADNFPVENITWEDAEEFVSEINIKNGNIGCQRNAPDCYFLPSEAEWEYAAGGGNQSMGYLYAGSDTLSYVAWYDANSEGSTHYMGRKFPNELGIMDMSGNVAEWVEDCQVADYYATIPDPKDPPPATATPCVNHVLRGGAFSTTDVSATSPLKVSQQSSGATLTQSKSLGFRIGYNAE